MANLQQIAEKNQKAEKFLGNLRSRYLKDQIIKNQKSIRIDPWLLKDALQEKYVNELSFFYFLKLNFVNGRIYKTGDPVNRVAELSGYSKRTVLRRFKALTDLGLLTTDQDAYILKKTPRNGYTKLKLINDKPDVKQIKNLLYLIPVEKAARNQVKRNNIRKWIEQGQRNQLTTMVDDTIAPALSHRYIAKLLNVSVQTAFVTMKTWKSMGLIKTKKQKPELIMRKCDPEAVKFLENNYRHRYMAGKIQMWEIKPQKVRFKLNPIQKEPITKERWKRYLKDAKVREFINEINKEQWQKIA